MTPEETKQRIEKEARLRYSHHSEIYTRHTFIEGANLVLNTLVAEKDREIAELKAAGEKMAGAVQKARNIIWLDGIDGPILTTTSEALSAWNALTKKAE